MKCYKCGNELPDGALFCDNCGSKMEQTEMPSQSRRFCANCGSEIEDEAVFCGNCGASTQQDSAPVYSNENMDTKETIISESNSNDYVSEKLPPKGANTKKGNGKKIIIFSMLAVIFVLICVLAVLFIAPNFTGSDNLAEEEYVQTDDKKSKKDSSDKDDEKEDDIDINEIDDDEIEDIIDDNVDYTRFGIYMRNLSNDYEYGYNEDAEFLASAMCQVVILDTLSRTVEQQGIDTATETLYFEYMPNGKEAPSSPSEDGFDLTLETCIEDVAIYGDNNKSNHLVDYIGEANGTSNGFTVINNMLRNNGYNNTKINRKTFINPDYIDYTASPNTTTPYEISNIFENLINNSSLGTTSYMRNIFKSVSNNGQAIGLKKFVPEKYNVCNVNAFTSESTNNVAIIDDGETEIVIAVLSNTDESKTKVENNDSREIVLRELIEYIIETQFEN